MIKKPLKTSKGWTWYLYEPIFDWPEEEMDVEESHFIKLEGGKYEHCENGVRCRTYLTEAEALQALQKSKV